LRLKNNVVFYFYRYKTPRFTFRLMRQSALIILSAGVIFTFAVSCDRVVSVEEEKSLDKGLNDITGMVWTLDSYDTEDDEHDLEKYASFNLVFIDTTTFTGDDGCNSFYGSFLIENNTFKPDDVAITLISCDFPVFSLHHLTEPFEIDISPDRLTISSEEEIYSYHNNYSEPVTGSMLAGERWHLVASDDPEIDEFEGSMIPELVLEEDRTYTIKWFCDEDASVFDCYHFSGFWGIGDRSAFLFYNTVSRGGSAGKSFVMRRLLNASAYHMDGEDLILIDEDADVKHRFESAGAK